MVCFDDDALADRALLLRRWGRRSEVQLFGSTKGVDKRFFSTIDGGDGFEEMEYDNLFIFDEVGWNFEPSELSAAFGLVQLDKLAENLARRQRNFELTGVALRPLARALHPPEADRRGRDGLAHVPGHHQRRTPGIRRSELAAVDGVATVSTPAWSGPATPPVSRRSGTNPTASRRAACPTPIGS